MEATYKVLGMTCGGCARSVTNALTQTTPDLQVEVSLDAATVRIVGEIDEAKVKDAVQGAGFEYGGRLAPASSGG